MEWRELGMGSLLLDGGGGLAPGSEKSVEVPHPCENVLLTVCRRQVDSPDVPAH